MRLLVKLGGTLLDDADVQARIVGDIAELARAGHQIVVVHGGGKQMTRFLTDQGVESRFIDGLRVTSPPVLDAVLKVLAGSVNTLLVAAFRKAGLKPVGLTGVDAQLTTAERVSESLGAVGKPVASNSALLDVLVREGYLPVLACVAGDDAGNIYNVNADQMAVTCAGTFQADSLLFLTDVDGVRGADGSICTQLSIAECDRLIRDGVATGGMQAKLNAATAALTGGVKNIRIARGAERGILARLANGDAVGTEVHP